MWPARSETRRAGGEGVSDSRQGPQPRSPLGPLTPHRQSVEGRLCVDPACAAHMGTRHVSASRRVADRWVAAVAGSCPGRGNGPLVPKPHPELLGRSVCTTQLGLRLQAGRPVGPQAGHPPNAVTARWPRWPSSAHIEELTNRLICPAFSGGPEETVTLHRLCSEWLALRTEAASQG